LKTSDYVGDVGGRYPVPLELSVSEAGGSLFNGNTLARTRVMSSWQGCPSRLLAEHPA
jgi:hypothetical protein